MGGVDMTGFMDSKIQIKSVFQENLDQMRVDFVNEYNIEDPEQLCFVKQIFDYIKLRA
jgi:hypothetical protein